MSQAYGSILDPHRRLKEPLGVKGNKQNVIVPNSPSTIDSDQILTVKFPDLGANDVIVPGSARLTFKIKLESATDPNRYVVNNLGRAIVKKISVKLEGQEVFSLHNSDIFFIYSDLWLTTNERADLAFQGIENDDTLKHRVDAEDAKDSNNKAKAVSYVYGNRFSIPLDFELLSAHAPYFQGALKDRLTYELTFNEYKRVIRSEDTETKYRISDISLEFDTVSNSSLARQIEQQYQSKLAIYYERVIHHSKYPKSRADTIWNFSFSAAARSLKGILLLCEDEEPYKRQTEKFINPKITKVQCSIEGSPNQIYASGLKPYQHFDEIRKLFGGRRNRHPTADLACKDLHLHNVRLDDYLTMKYGLWIDLRSTEDNQLHGSGRPVNDNITIQIEKEKENDKPLNVYLFLIYDAQLNIEGKRLKDIVY